MDVSASTLTPAAKVKVFSVLNIFMLLPIPIGLQRPTVLVKQTPIWRMSVPPTRWHIG
jgi:hypothetical protein